MDSVLDPVAAALESASQQLALRDSIAAGALATANAEIGQLRLLVATLRAQLEAPAGFAALVCENTGSLDVTDAWQAGLAAGPVYAPAGVYLVDPLRTLLVTHSITFHADALLVAKATAASRYCVMKVVGDDVDLQGVNLRGDRLSHLYPAGESQEWCSGLLITGARCSVKDGTISEFPGDGIGVAGDGCVLDRVTATKNGRNNVSVFASTGTRIRGCTLSDVGALGASPSAPDGPCANIDFEQDSGEITDAHVENCRIANGRVGIEAWTRANIPGKLELTATGNTIDRCANAMLGKGLGGPVRISAFRNTITKSSGSAFRAEHGATITAGDGTIENANVITGMAVRSVATLGVFSGIVTRYDFLATGPFPATPGVLKVGFNDYR